MKEISKNELIKILKNIYLKTENLKKRKLEYCNTASSEEASLIWMFLRKNSNYIEDYNEYKSLQKKNKNETSQDSLEKFIIKFQGKWGLKKPINPDAFKISKSTIFNFPGVDSPVVLLNSLDHIEDKFKERELIKFYNSIKLGGKEYLHLFVDLNFTNESITESFAFIFSKLQNITQNRQLKYHQNRLHNPCSLLT